MPPRSFTQASASPLLRQFAKFGLVGVLGFVVDVGGFNLLRYAGGEGPLYHYPLTREDHLGPARHRRGLARQPLLDFPAHPPCHGPPEFLLFAVVAVIGTLIAWPACGSSHYLLGLTSPLADNISANGVGLALAHVLPVLGVPAARLQSVAGDGSPLSADGAPGLTALPRTESPSRWARPR